MIISSLSGQSGLHKITSGARTCSGGLALRKKAAMNGPSPHQAAAAAWNHGFVSIRMDPATPASLLTSQPASFLFSLFPSSPWTPNGPPSLWADPLYVSFLNWDDQIFICWGTESPFLSSDWVPVDEESVDLLTVPWGLTPDWGLPQYGTPGGTLHRVECKWCPLEFCRAQPVWPNP